MSSSNSEALATSLSVSFLTSSLGRKERKPPLMSVLLSQAQDQALHPSLLVAAHFTGEGRGRVAERSPARRGLLGNYVIPRLGFPPRQDSLLPFTPLDTSVCHMMILETGWGRVLVQSSFLHIDYRE